MLIFPSAELEYDESNLSEVVFVLKAHPSYCSYISASTGAINRALAVINSRGFAVPGKISHSTSDDLELELEEKIAQLIPYFVKADLLLAESPEESRAARELFDSSLAAIQGEGALQSNTVYKCEELMI